jgi:hypothetical protein
VGETSKLQWKGDELFLGKTKMAEVRERGDARRAYPDFEYVLGPNDKVSKPYWYKEDARQDCMTEVLRLLKTAGVDL